MYITQILKYFIDLLSLAQCRDGEIRLRIGQMPSRIEGRVEICFGQQWGTVYEGRWDDDDANVVCGQLGFSNSGGNQ